MADLNDDDTHSFTVDDSRFEVVGGKLKLKKGEAVDFETTTSIAVTVTATDSFNLSYEEVFTIGVINVVDRIKGRQGHEKIHGGDGDDVIRARGGNDKLWGHGGDDHLRSKGGNDKLWGGTGADTFVYSTKSGLDTIMDFETGIDKIDIRMWKAVTDFDDLKSHASTRDGNLWIKAGAEVLIVNNLLKRDLVEADFLI